MEKRKSVRAAFGFVCSLMLFLIITVLLVNKFRFLNEKEKQIEIKPEEYVLDSPRQAFSAVLEDSLLGIDNPNTNFAYLQLSEEEKATYKQIASAVCRFEERVEIAYSDNLAKVYRAVLMDHPEYFWVDEAYVAWGNIMTQSVHFIELSFNSGRIEKAWNQYQIDTAVEQCVSQIAKQASDYEKVKYVYEYVIKNVDYVDNSTQNQNIQSVFLNHESVCAGYAKATQLLLNKLNIFSTYIVGTAKTDQASFAFPNEQFGHAWNLVQVEGEYYYVDTTWGDPVFSKEAFHEDDVSYDYLCITTEELLRSRDIDEAFEVPLCSAVTYNYYVQEQKYLENFQEEEFIKAIKKEITEGQYGIAYKFATQDVYKEAFRSLFEERKIEDVAQYYLRKTGRHSCNYFYIEDEQIYTLKILLQ